MPHLPLRIAAQLGISSFLWFLSESLSTDFPILYNGHYRDPSQLENGLRRKDPQIWSQKKNNKFFRHKEAREADWEKIFVILKVNNHVLERASQISKKVSKSLIRKWEWGMQNLCTEQ